VAENGVLKPLPSTIAAFGPRQDELETAGLPPGTAIEVAKVKKKTQPPAFDPSNPAEGRQRVLQEMWQRQGQGTFRSTLLDAYAGRCAITGFDVGHALDAAHITPYRGPQTNNPQNGLVLRADIHNLFDLYLISVDVETMTVVISEKLKGTSYESLSGQKLALPKDPALRPHHDALRTHRAEFDRRAKS
jgi:predicted restriction endonuclease